ncbi:hypothetical protein J4429_03870 [Candidatus Pacearchaeota archaeon]|nr:hypothetical protein [Candidatus Pacearchaeota archaeon]
MRTDRLEDQGPVNLPRIGSFEGDLEKVLTDFSLGFHKRASQPNIQAYGFFYAGKDPYLLNISNEKRKIRAPEDYNTLLIITSHSRKKNQQVIKEFQHLTGIDFQRPAPMINPVFLANLRTYELIFDMLLDKPDEVIAFLKKLEKGTEYH